MLRPDQELGLQVAVVATRCQAVENVNYRVHRLATVATLIFKVGEALAKIVRISRYMAIASVNPAMTTGSPIACKPRALRRHRCADMQAGLRPLRR